MPHPTRLFLPNGGRGSIWVAMSALDTHTQRLVAAMAGTYRIERKLVEGGMASVYPRRGPEAQAEGRAHGGGAAIRAGVGA